MALSFEAVLGLILMVYGLSLPAGKLLTDWVAGLNTTPLGIRIPVYITVGLLTGVPVFVVAGLWQISPLTAMAPFSLATLALVWRRHPFREKKPALGSALVESAIPIALFLSITLFFSATVASMKWPPPGDIMTTHGPLLALLELNRKIPLIMQPFLILYPPGFHVTASTLLSGPFGLYPAESVFVFGAALVSLLPAIVYALVFQVSRSKIFSLIGFVSALLVHPSLNLERWPVGFFYNGPYPNLFAYVLLIALVYLVQSAIFRQKGSLVRIVATSGIGLVSLMFTYPPFALLLGLSLSAVMLVQYRNQIRSLARKTKAMFLILFTTTASVLLYGLQSFRSSVFLGYLEGVYIPRTVLPPLYSGGLADQPLSAYQPPLDFFVDSYSGVVVLLALPLSIFLVKSGKFVAIALFELVSIAVVALSLLPGAIGFVIFFLPSRTLILASLLSWPVFLHFLSNVSVRPIPALFQRVPRRIVSGLSERKIGGRRLLALFMLVILVPFLWTYFTFQDPVRWGWFSNSPAFEDDFRALKWLVSNSRPTDLILNDGSYSSRYLMSLRVSNLSLFLWNEIVYPQRTADTVRLWTNPYDMPFIADVLRNYNVTFVLSTSEWGYVVPGGSMYRHKLLDPHIYAQALSQYRFLKPVFQSGWTRIFSVERPSLNLIEGISYEVSNASDFWDGSASWNEGQIGLPILSNSSPNVTIDKGSYSSWGIWHTFQSIQDWSKYTFVSISIWSNSTAGAALRITDASGGSLYYEFQIRDEDDAYYLALGSASFGSGVDLGSVVKVGVETGYSPPFASPGSVVAVYSITLYSLGD